MDAEKLTLGPSPLPGPRHTHAGLEAQGTLVQVAVRVSG